MSEEIRSISDVLRDLNRSLTGDKVSVAHIMEAFHERGFGFALLFFSLPAGLPLPPGPNLIFAIPLFMIAVQQVMGRHTVWLPVSLMKRQVKSSTLSGMIDKIVPWAEKLEILIKPRLEFVTQGIFSHITGIFSLLMAACLCIPLPLIHTVPSLGIALMAVGVIMRDGLAVILGAIMGTLWIALMVFVIIFMGTEGIHTLKDVIGSWF